MGFPIRANSRAHQASPLVHKLDAQGWICHDLGLVTLPSDGIQLPGARVGHVLTAHRHPALGGRQGCAVFAAEERELVRDRIADVFRPAEVPHVPILNGVWPV